jgi:hypothetical protein
MAEEMKFNNLSEKYDKELREVRKELEPMSV